MNWKYKLSLLHSMHRCTRGYSMDRTAYTRVGYRLSTRVDNFYERTIMNNYPIS